MDDLSLSLDTLLLQHPQAKGYRFKTKAGKELPVLFSLRELPLNGEPIYTENASSVVRVEEDKVLLGGRVTILLKAAAEEKAVRALTPAIRALDETRSKEVTLKVPGDGLLTAEEVVERLAGCKLIEGIPLMTQGGSGAGRGLVVFTLAELEREEYSGVSFTDMEAKLSLKALGGGGFLINERTYHRAAPEDCSEGEEDGGSSLLDPELAALDLTMPGGGIARSLEQELEKIKEGQRLAEAEGQLKLSLENVDQFMDRIEDRKEARKDEKETLVREMMDQYTAKYEDLLSPRSKAAVQHRLIARSRQAGQNPSGTPVEEVAHVVAEVRQQQQQQQHGPRP